jgi:hypothetical protein
MSQVCQGVSEGGEFSIKDRDDAGLMLVEHDVPDPEAAVRHRGDVIVRYVVGKPCNQPLDVGIFPSAESSHCLAHCAI